MYFTLQHFLSSGPIANLYERQTRCVFTNLGYIQDFLLGGNILVIYLNILTCGGWGWGGGGRQACLTEFITFAI